VLVWLFKLIPSSFQAFFEPIPLLIAPSCQAPAPLARLLIRPADAQVALFWPWTRLARAPCASYQQLPFVSILLEGALALASV
jgi:hypothetical protein